MYETVSQAVVSQAVVSRAVVSRAVLSQAVVVFIAADVSPPGSNPTSRCVILRYRPPVREAVSQPFSLPKGPYGPGNRGLEYQTSRGEVVAAIGDGVVQFAGPVGGFIAVTIHHPDGLRSSYSYLESASVAVGDNVLAGTEIGRSSDRLQLGVRSGGKYLDPALLFARVVLRLVPDSAFGATRLRSVGSACPPTG